MPKTYPSSKQRLPKEPEIGNKSGKSDGNGKTELIQHRAYEIYEERIRQNIPGDTLSDWVKAEQEVNSMKKRSNRQYRAASST